MDNIVKDIQKMQEQIAELSKRSGIITLFANTDGATVALNTANGSFQSLTIAGNRTLTLSCPVGQGLVLFLTYGGAYSVTWFSTIKWFPDGTVPTQTSVNNKTDCFQFFCYAPNQYYGFVLGQNV